MPYEDHIAEAKDAVTCAVLTISDTRTEEDDKSGKIIQELLQDGGHSVGYYAVVKDEPDQIKRLIIDIASKGECHVPRCGYGRQRRACIGGRSACSQRQMDMKTHVHGALCR